MRIIIAILVFMYLRFGIYAQSEGPVDRSGHDKSFSLVNFIEAGSIGVGSAYGGLQPANGELICDPYYFTEGNIDLRIGRIPFTINFYLSNLAHQGGRRNSIRLNYNFSKYQAETIQKSLEDKSLLAFNIDSLLARKKTLAEQLAFQIMQKNNTKHDQLEFDTVNTIDKLTPFIDGERNIVVDSLQRSDYQNPITAVDSSAINKSKSANSFYSGLMDEYHRTNELIKQYDQALKRRDEMQFLKYRHLGKFTTGLEKFKVQQFKLGTTAPSISPLTLFSTRLNGLHFTAESKSIHFEFAGGWINPQYSFMINPLDAATNRNFREILNTRQGNLLFGRTGFGSVKSSHLYASFLGGTDNIGHGNFSDLRNRKSMNVEIEGQLVRKRNSISLNWAKLLRSQSPVMDQTATSDNSDKSTQSILVKGNYNLEKIQTMGEVEYLWVGPLYYTIGNPFLRNDNSKIAGKINNRSWKYLQPGIFGSYNRNNVMRIYDYEQSIRQVGGELMSKPIQSLTIKLAYAPSVLKSETLGERRTTRSSMHLYSISYVLRKKKETVICTSSYSRNQQIWDSTLFDLTNVLVNLQYNHGSKLSTSLAIQRMEILQNDSNSKIMNFQSSSTIKINKSIQFQFGATVWNAESTISAGLQSSLSVQISENFNVFASAEKYPDNVSILNALPQAQNLPYFFLIKLIYQFKNERSH
jgi:hypothetical protein